MPRHPSTRDCAVDGCTRAEYRLGLCRHHVALVPPDLGARCAAACLAAQAVVKRQYHSQAASLANMKLGRAPTTRRTW